MNISEYTLGYVLFDDLLNDHEVRGGYSSL